MEDKINAIPEENISSVPGEAGDHSVVEHLFYESLSMTKFALSRGAKIPGSVVNIVGKYEHIFQSGKVKKIDMRSLFDQLNYAHSQLADLIEPVSPGTCRLIIEDAEKKSFWNIFGAVPMARKIAAVAFISLIAMLGISLSIDVSSETLSEGLLNNHGRILLQNLIFLLSAASLGASFSLLFKINRELENGGYEKEDDAAYVSTWIMGIAAGMILSEVIPLNMIAGSGSEVDSDGVMDAAHLSKLILALVGGFASSLVYNILNTIVDAIGSAFKKDNREEISQESKKIRSELNRQMVINNMKLANRLARFSHLLKEGGDPEPMGDELEKMIMQLLGKEQEVELEAESE